MGDTMTMALSAPNTTVVAFDALYRACVDDVHAYAWSLLRDRAAAEDVTALAFERAYRKRHRFDASKGTERAWVFTIARNAALDELRRRRRTAALMIDPEDPAAAGAVTRPGEEAERRATVRAALSALDPRDRELVALK
ncbi:MAG: sigma-70 family polymerase sigma factor, partial [Solirubrobacterales bacterium]|nr:sigma-70 family polymerase sigma factor [Solirubrobacterales bacterium]